MQSIENRRTELYFFGSWLARVLLRARGVRGKTQRYEEEHEEFERLPKIKLEWFQIAPPWVEMFSSP